MHCRYKEICKKFGCKCKVFTQCPADFKNQIGNPDTVLIIIIQEFPRFHHAKYACTLPFTEIGTRIQLILGPPGDSDSQDGISPCPCNHKAYAGYTALTAPRNPLFQVRILSLSSENSSNCNTPLLLQNHIKMPGNPSQPPSPAGSA